MNTTDEQLKREANAFLEKAEEALNNALAKLRDAGVSSCDRRQVHVLRKTLRTLDCCSLPSTVTKPNV